MNYYDEEENDEFGLGTAATALAGLGLATPMGKPFRKKAADLYKHFGSPFAPQLSSMGNELGKVGSVLRSDLAQGTGQLSELGARAFSKPQESVLRFEAPGKTRPVTDNFSGAATKQNWNDTVEGTKNLARAIAAMASGTPSAVKTAINGVKADVANTIEPEQWGKFIKSSAGRNFTPEALKEMDTYGVSDPFTAALMYLKKHA